MAFFFLFCEQCINVMLVGFYIYCMSNMQEALRALCCFNKFEFEFEFNSGSKAAVTD